MAISGGYWCNAVICRKNVKYSYKNTIKSKELCEKNTANYQKVFAIVAFGYIIYINLLLQNNIFLERIYSNENI